MAHTDVGERPAPRGFDPRRAQRWIRNAIYLTSALGALYLVWRFELVRLPQQGCSPLLRVGPGDLLMFDMRGAHYGSWDVVLFRGPEGQLLLGEIRPAEEGPGTPPEPAREHFWIRTDRPDCPGLDSMELGWIPRRDLVGRLLLASGQF